MKNINKKFIVAGIFFSLPILSLADLEIQDTTVKKTLPINDATVMKLPSVTFNLDSSHIDLKWKIEDNNVILSWEEYSGTGNVLGYRIISISPDGEQRTISVGAHETSVKDLDVKLGKNIYQLFVVGESGDLAKSAKIIVKVGSNGNHDFEDKERELKGMHARHSHHIGHCHYHTPKLDFLTQDLSPEDKAKVEELKKAIEESIKSIEESVKSLKESAASHNLEEIKSKVESLKQEYIAKINELGLSDEAKKVIETKFLIFFQPTLCEKEEIKNLIQERKEQFKIVKDDFREKMKELKKDLKDARSEMKQMKHKIRNVKHQFHTKKDDLKAKYKEQFAEKLAGRLDNFTADKIRNVIAKVDLAMEKYKANEKLSSSQKERFITQLNALKDLLQEKLDEIENSIDLDELLRD